MSIQSAYNTNMKEREYTIRKLPDIAITYLVLFTIILIPGYSAVKDDRTVMIPLIVAVIPTFISMIMSFCNPDRIRIDELGIHYKTSDKTFIRKYWTSYTWQDIESYYFSINNNNGRSFPYPVLNLTLRNQEDSNVSISLRGFLFRKKRMREYLKFYGGEYCQEDIEATKQDRRYNCLFYVVVFVIILILWLNWVIND